MNCVICNKSDEECLDFVTYTRGKRDVMVCTAHQPLAELTSAGSLERTVHLRLLKEALNLTWAQVDKPEVTS